MAWIIVGFLTVFWLGIEIGEGRESRRRQDIERENRERHRRWQARQRASLN